MSHRGARTGPPSRPAHTLRADSRQRTRRPIRRVGIDGQPNQVGRSRVSRPDSLSTKETPCAATAPPSSRSAPGRSVPSWLVLSLVLVGQFMVVLDASIVNVALPSIQRDLHFSTSGLQWIVNAYTLTFAGFLLLGGRAADLFGRRQVFLIGLTVFTASSLLGGLAQNEAWLVTARALQGLGRRHPGPGDSDDPHCDLPRRPDARLGSRCVERRVVGRRLGRRAARRHPDRLPELALDSLRQRARSASSPLIAARRATSPSRGPTWSTATSTWRVR